MYVLHPDVAIILRMVATSGCKRGGMLFSPFQAFMETSYDMGRSHRRRTLDGINLIPVPI